MWLYKNSNKLVGSILPPTRYFIFLLHLFFILMKHILSLLSKPKTLSVLVSFLFLTFLSVGLTTNANAQTTGDYRTTANTTFVSATGWQTYDGTNWIAATTAPTSTDGTISIRGSHTVEVTANITLDQLSVQWNLTNQ